MVAFGCEPMPCFHPLAGWRARVPGPSGKRRLVFKQEEGIGDLVQIPCGQCIGCRLEHSRQWAVRCMHEASLHDENCFLTLTYSPEFLPSDLSLDKRHFPAFMKRLRSRFPDRKIRYFHCGEYGERLGRPHYHACLFGFDFPDKVYYKDAGGHPLFVSETLNSTWGLGFCTIGAVTFESAAYTARYVLKKITGESAQEHYLQVDPVTGEIACDDSGDFLCKQPEYVTMSRRPGIAAGWFDRFSRDVFPSDEVIARGVKCRPPRYYDKLFEAAHGPEFERIKAQRVERASKHADNNTLERRTVREICTEARVSLLRRGFEGGSGETP